MSWNERLKKTMPHGSSTTSKAPIYLPEEPQALVRGFGCRTYDVAGREFIDYRNSLGPVTLGYCYPAVNEAIKKQLENGIIYGHPHTLECEVSEMLCEVIPCAEQARFLKTGGEACAAVIRIARAYTGRKHTIQIGYNGWVNSLAQGAQVLPNQKSAKGIPGVPSEISSLYHAVSFGDTETLKALFENYKDDIACVIVAVAYDKFFDGATFYPFLRELTEKNGALLIYDEIVTGFRVAMGGVQEYFGVTPDLCVFAKGIANGMPLSVYSGKREFMKTCEMPGFSISSTYGGETLSLAACKAVIETYRKEKVTDYLFSAGEYLWTRLNALFDKYKIKLQVSGYWACPILSGEQEMRAKFFRLAYKHGISLYQSVSYVNFSHKKEDLDETLCKLELAIKEL